MRFGTARAFPNPVNEIWSPPFWVWNGRDERDACIWTIARVLWAAGMWVALRDEPCDTGGEEA